MPRGVVVFVIISSTDVAMLPELRKTLAGETMAVGPPEIDGMIEPASETVPLKPPVLAIVTLTNPIEPAGRLRKDGLVVMKKSGTGVVLIVSTRMAVWAIEPPVAVRVREYGPGMVLLPAPTKMFPVAFPPGVTVASEVPSAKSQVTPGLQIGIGSMLVSLTVIVPEKPLRLVTS